MGKNKDEITYHNKDVLDKVYSLDRAFQIRIRLKRRVEHTSGKYMCPVTVNKFSLPIWKAPQTILPTILL